MKKTIVALTFCLFSIASPLFTHVADAEVFLRYKEKGAWVDYKITKVRLWSQEVQKFIWVVLTYVKGNKELEVTMIAGDLHPTGAMVFLSLLSEHLKSGKNSTLVLTAKHLDKPNYWDFEFSVH